MSVSSDTQQRYDLVGLCLFTVEEVINVGPDSQANCQGQSFSEHGRESTGEKNKKSKQPQVGGLNAFFTIFNIHIHMSAVMEAACKLANPTPLPVARVHPCR